MATTAATATPSQVSPNMTNPTATRPYPVAMTGMAGRSRSQRATGISKAEDEPRADRDEGGVEGQWLAVVTQVQRERGVELSVDEVDQDDSRQEQQEGAVGPDSPPEPGRGVGLAHHGCLVGQETGRHVTQHQGEDAVEHEERVVAARGEQGADGRTDDEARVRGGATDRDRGAPRPGRHGERREGSLPERCDGAEVARDGHGHGQQPDRLPRDEGGEDAHDAGREEQDAAVAVAVAEAATRDVPEQGTDAVRAGDDTGRHDAQPSRPGEVEHEEEHEEGAGRADEPTGGRQHPDDSGEVSQVSHRHIRPQ